MSWRLVNSRSITSAGSREPGKKHTPRNWTMCGWRRVLISWHSCTNSRDAFWINSESGDGLERFRVFSWLRIWLLVSPPPPRCHRRQHHALSVGEERKRAAHSEACHAVGVTFIPMVVETLGGWGEEAALTVKIIGRLQGLRLGIPTAQATRHLFQRLAINLWRGNATLWIRRLPTRSPEVDGLI